jgi:hypothetical protein
VGAAENGVEPSVALDENVIVQRTAVAAKGVFVQLGGVFALEAVKCLECWVQFGVVVATVVELSVALVVSTGKTVQQDRREFILICLSAERCDSERY